MKYEFLLTALIVFSVSISAHPDNELTYAERLGWDKGSRVLILHIDDVGLCYGANIATVESLTRGVATSCSVMVPCAWVDQFIQVWKKNPQWDVGIHLTLTSEWDNYRWRPVAGFSQVPTLFDPNGFMWDNVALTIANASPNDIDKEIQAQLALIEHCGLKPTHLDSHMGTLFATTANIEKYVNLGIEKKIPIMFPGGHCQYLLSDLPIRKEALQEWARKIWEAGLPVLDDIITFTYDWKTEDKMEQIKKTLTEMKPGLTQIIFHPAIPTEEFPHFTQSATTRKGDYLLLTNPEFKKFLEDNQFILTTWRELMHRRQNIK